jgi:hypothetical protein
MPFEGAEDDGYQGVQSEESEESQVEHFFCSTWEGGKDRKASGAFVNYTPRKESKKSQQSEKCGSFRTETRPSSKAHDQPSKFTIEEKQPSGPKSDRVELLGEKDPPESRRERAFQTDPSHDSCQRYMKQDVTSPNLHLFG